MPDPTPTTSTEVIPPEQQPLNQYQELNQSFFSGWPTLPLPNYLKGMARVWLVTLLLTAPISAASFPPQAEGIHWGIATVLGSNGLLTLVIVRLYLGWHYVRQRLFRADVAYEESGWYDVTIATKSSEELAQHQLIARYQVDPVLQRIQRTLGWMVLISLGIGLMWPLGRH